MAATTSTHTGAGPGTAATGLFGGFNAELKGTFVAHMQLERSLDSGATWVPVSFALGNANSYNSPVSFVANEPESGAQVQWRWNCVNYVSGTVLSRLSQ